MDISVSDAPVGRLLDGRYRIEALLARGGMATVYRAVDVRLDRQVALKVMHAELAADDEFVARFIGEARAVAQLSDPNVVNVFDQGEDDGAVFLAMEYIEGRTLRDVLHDRGRLGADLALEVAESVLSALAAAHRAGIVHRDVKPENVLVGSDGRVKVADFGLARALTNSSKTTRGLLGTVNYISPEQALGEKATPRSDVYSAGIMLFELLTGRTPHEGPTDFVIVRSHIDEDVPPPSDFVPLPRAVDDLVLTATSREPAGRYADAGEFLAATRIARASLVGVELPADDDDVTEIAALHAEPRDSAGVTLEEALAGTVLADQLGPPPPPPASPSSGPSSSTSHTRLLREEPPVSGWNEEPDGWEERAPAAPAAAPATARRTAAHRAEQRRSGRRGMIMFLLVLLLAVGVAAAAWWYGSGRWETTPSLLNIAPEQAVTKAGDAGFTAVTGGEEFSEAVEAGLVLSTEPGPGEQILRGGEIKLIVSKGPERYEVPALAGLSVADATAALEDMSLTIRVADEVYHDEVPEGSVVSQNVEAGEQVRRGSEVAVVVSLGRQPIEIQDFTGRSAEEANAALSEAGFKVESREENSDEVAAGIVISQEPAGGNGFNGDEIQLVVSLGAELVEVPQIIGERVERAEERLREAGFEVEIVDLFGGGPGGGDGDGDGDGDGSDGDNDGDNGDDRRARVVRVEPMADQLPRGSTVTIYHF